jgi:nicotinamidase-related amidase
MSAFEGTPLSIALRDRGISSIAIVGIAREVGIEPTEALQARNRQNLRQSQCSRTSIRCAGYPDLPQPAWRLPGLPMLQQMA